MYDDPDILDCGRFVDAVSDPAAFQGERMVRDYEIDYINAARVMRLDGELYQLSPGSVVFRRPGQVVASKVPIDIYMLTLDYTHTLSPTPDIRHDVHPLQPPVFSGLPALLPPVFVPRHGMELLALYRQLAAVCHLPGRTEESRSLLMELMHLLAADALADRRGSQHPPAVDRAIAYLSEHYPRRITLDELAAHVHQNKSYLIRRFRQATGVTPMAFLAHIRLSSARRLLAESGCSVAEAAAQCGYEDAAYFTLCFRRAFGCTPAAWRRQRP